MHPAWRENDGWYEEDCDWAIAALTFPAEFETYWASQGRPNTVVEAARGCAIRWHENQYREVFPDRAEADIAAEKAAMEFRIAARQA